MLIDYFNKFYHDVLKQSNQYSGRAVSHTNRSALQFIQPDWLQPGTLGFSITKTVMSNIKYEYGCITPELVGRAKRMLSILIARQNDVGNDLRHFMIYTDILKILIGQFVDLNKYNNTDYLIVLLAVAFSVYNERTKASVLNTINPLLLNTLGYSYNHSILIPTLVIYDYNKNTIIGQFRAVDEVNLYINNLAYNEIDNIPLLNYYIAIKEQYPDYESYGIHDPETAIRLIRYFSYRQIAPYLAPATKFDKQVLIERGLREGKSGTHDINKSRSPATYRP